MNAFLESCEESLPPQEVFAPRLPQAPWLHSQHSLQHVSRCFSKLNHPREVDRLALLHEEQFNGGISKIFKQREDRSGCLIRIGRGEHAFCDSLLNDLRGQGCKSFDPDQVKFLAKKGVLIGMPDAQKREDQV